MSDSEESGGAVQHGLPDCDMPDCSGSPEDGTHAARDPAGTLLDICDGCLNDGWRSVVEVLD